MSLHVEVAGCGEPLVMLHGWGMHSGVWNEISAQLAQTCQMHFVDLPGHGKSPLAPPADGKADERASMERQHTLSYSLPRMSERGWALLDEIVDALIAQFPGPVNLCGWSLGGQIALRWAAREPDKVKRLVLVASTPCFAAREDWSSGMDRNALQQFAADLEKNHAATLRRFLALQVRGSEGERELLEALRERIFSRGEPHPNALRGGLEILRDADLRELLPEIKQPTLVIAGERDKLTPPAASHYLAQTLPDARMVEINGAAHAPFLSHRDEFVNALTDFMKNDERI